MKLLFQIVSIILIFVQFTAAAQENEEIRSRRPKHTMPIREIDRPLLLPQKQMKISAGYTAGFTWDRDSGITEYSWTHFPNSDGVYSMPSTYVDYPMVLLPEIRYAINDSLQLTLGFNDLPTLHYAFINNSVVENGEVTIAKPSLAAFVGIYSLFGNTGIAGSFEFELKGGLQGKFPFSERLWGDATLAMMAGNRSSIGFRYNAALGIQLMDKLALLPEVDIEQRILPNEDVNYIIPSFRTTLDCNFTNHFSMDFYGVAKEDPVHTLEVSYGATMHFNW